ncbi:precorrin-6A synthase (deacetylating) [Frankia sp. AiPs1]|uniref:precorrin-6A synthase (deacetylating) n=1 Tax=Frankia sp. AiPs1 TaxID=573493 RepID=UPI002042ECA1|nr:precorrin-6A synthase (deacetylating) [Frankia sp. AiPs1]MCM3921570.1 precorrin-6A synthase (deacetylating) [Frankia sp. AiPs1]
MRTVLVVGIGAGDPDQLTIQAVKALGRADVFFVLDKGPAKDDLVRLRREILDRHVGDGGYRIVEARDPRRDRNPADAAAYAAAVDDWHDRRAELYERMILDELPEEGCGAFLVWGDPSLYDSTLRIVERVAARGRVTFDYEVIPGITSVQALAASHRLVLNRIGGPVEITTGRRLAEGFPPGVDDVVVMLDADTTFRTLDDPDLDIYWGAYLGTPDEMLMHGRVADVGSSIARTRADARRRKGWIMDIYLLRRRPPATGSAADRRRPSAATTGADIVESSARLE